MIRSLKINILLVGTGEVAARFMVGISNLKGVNVIYVYSRNLLKAQKFCEDWGIKNFTNDLNSNLNDVDIAYISTPNSTHFDIASILIKNKINVLVEKPIVTNLNQLHELINLSVTHEVNILDGIWTLYNPLILSAISINKKYKPISIDSYLCFNNPAESSVLNSVENGGAIKDILTYQLYLSALFCNSKKLEVIHNQYFFNRKNIDYEYKLKIKSDNITSNLYGNIASPSKSKFIIHYDKFDVIIFNPIFNPKILIFKPTKYTSLLIILTCFIYNIRLSFCSLKILINRLFLKTNLYKNPLHPQLIDLIGLISGNIKNPAVPLKMTVMVVGVLDFLTK